MAGTFGSSTDTWLKWKISINRQLNVISLLSCRREEQKEYMRNQRR
jgi:hypothetical protein